MDVRFIPFDDMSDAQQVEHLVVVHGLDESYWNGDVEDPTAHLASMTREWRAQNWHDGEHDPLHEEGTEPARIPHCHDKALVTTGRHAL